MPTYTRNSHDVDDDFSMDPTDEEICLGENLKMALEDKPFGGQMNEDDLLEYHKNRLNE